MTLNYQANTGGAGTAGTINIPAGNYTASSLATYLNSATADFVTAYNSATLGFTFTPGIYLKAGSTGALVIGFPSTYLTSPGTTFTTSSPQPISLMGPNQIHVNTNLPLYTVPVSGRLCNVPVTSDYGSLISYRDLNEQVQNIVNNSNLQNLEITLTDENNVTLEGYEDIPWRMILSIEVIHDQGFVNPGEGHGVGLVPRTIADTQNYYNQAAQFAQLKF